MNPIINIVASDYGYNLNFTLQDSQGNLFSLTGSSSLLFRVQRYGNAHLKFASPMVVDSLAAGTCHYTVNQGDFDLAGQYVAEIQVNFSTSESITFSNITLIASPRVPY